MIELREHTEDDKYLLIVHLNNQDVVRYLMRHSHCINGGPW